MSQISTAMWHCCCYINDFTVKWNFHYVAMPMVMSQILRSADFTKIQKSRQLENKTFFFQIKKIFLIYQELRYGENSFVVYVNL